MALRTVCVQHLLPNYGRILLKTQNVLRSTMRSLSALPVDVVSSLQTILGEQNVSSSEALRQQCARDESYYGGEPPDVVIFPQSTSDVSRCARVCYDNHVPIIPYGTGTGVSGGISAPYGGVTFNLTQMDQVLEVNPEDFDCTVQAGVKRKSLEAYIRDTGLWFPIDPGADASLCGMAATSASGTNAVRYGTMRENVINMQVVLADGTVIHTAGQGCRARKRSAGYNLTNLFVGSEGTLGVITSVTLRLHPIPAATAAAICQFTTIQEAIETAVMVLQSGLPIARIELVDERAIRACNAYNKLSFAEKPTLFLEFNGSSEQYVQEQATQVAELASENGGSAFDWTRDETERRRLWQARHTLQYAIGALRPGFMTCGTDVCVPLSKLSQVVVDTADEFAKSSITYAVLGHVGDGNFHVTIACDKNDDDMIKEVNRLADNAARRALRAGGSCSAEHGIGISKRHLLPEEIGEHGIAVMKRIKESLDPRNIMNPGKVL